MLINIPHRIAPHRCPVNGLCDLYEWQKGYRLPEELLFDCRIGFKQITQPDGMPPEQIYLSEGGVGESEYLFWSDKLGYNLHRVRDQPFPEALAAAKALLDRRIPVILFGLDLYHLPYHDKFYHRFHVPGHVVLLVGYDEDRVYVHDNDRPQVQAIPLSDLASAWARDYMGNGANAAFGIEMNGKAQDPREIVQAGLSSTAAAFLRPDRPFLGVAGYDRFLQDLSTWLDRYDDKTLRGILEQFVTFTGSTIPELPPGLQRYPTGVHNPHRGCRDRFAGALRQHWETLGNPGWTVAADLLDISGSLIEELTGRIAELILGENYAALPACGDLFARIRMLEQTAWSNLESTAL